MDIVHHAVIGIVGLTVLSTTGNELAGLGFLAGSVLPDLDVAFILGGKRAYLKLHQGPTHSLVLAPLIALGLSLLAIPLVGFDWTILFGILAGIALHTTLDLFNTFGIQAVWPLTPRRYCLDAVFFIDTVAWMLTLGTLAVMLTWEASVLPAAGVYLVLMVAYFALKLILQRHVRATAGADFVIPTAFNPFRFNVFSRRGGVLETAEYSALSRRISNVRSLPISEPEVRALAAKSELFRDMQRILRSLEITEVTRNSEGMRIVANDLAIRNFGGKFGRTELQFDAKGDLKIELAHI